MNQKIQAVTRRTAVAAGIAAVAAPAVIGRAKAATSVTWRVQSHWPKASSSYGDSLQVVADEIEKLTDGRMKLQLHGAGEFAKGAEIFNIVRRGVVEMGTISPGYILGEAETAGLVFGIPGTFRAPWEMAHYLKNLGVEAIFNAELATHGVMFRAEKIYPTEVVVKNPINSIDDFKALKIRSSGTMMKYLEAAGAAPSYIAGPELYQGLASGVVDGAHWGAAQGALSMSLWEVAKYHMRPPLGLACDGFIMNQAAVDALPADLRAEFLGLLELRFWIRTTEYQHKEEVALSKGRSEQGVTVMQYPQAVLDKLAEASTTILEEERGKGPKAAEAGDKLVAFLRDLGYI